MTFNKLMNKSCGVCKKKELLFISLQDGNVLCKEHINQAHLQLKKETFMINCFECNTGIPIEKSLLRAEFENFKKKAPNIRILGCTGLLNLGNTCYINSIIQVLSNLKSIKNYFLYYVSTKETYEILKEFNLLLLALWQGEKFFAPKNFIMNADAEFHQLNRNRHQDTLEFFHFLHNIIDKQMMQQLENNTFFTDIFTWKVEISIECMKCKKKSNSYEEFLELPLCIPTKYEINDLRIKSDRYLCQKDKDDMVFVTNTVWKKMKQ